jgi:hypothetical protein
MSFFLADWLPVFLTEAVDDVMVVTQVGLGANENERDATCVMPYKN